MASDGARAGAVAGRALSEPAGQVLGHAEGEAPFGSPNVSAATLTLESVDDVGSPSGRNVILEGPHPDGSSREDDPWGRSGKRSLGGAAKLVTEVV